MTFKKFFFLKFVLKNRETSLVKLECKSYLCNFGFFGCMYKMIALFLRAFLHLASK
jgi:hypothetical protein